MLIFEVEDSRAVDSGKLLALTKFLAGRAKDTNAKLQVSSKAFIKFAQGLGVNITEENLGDIISREPLSNVLEPYQPNSNVVSFKGNTDAPDTSMNANQAQEVVAQNAKDAMKRGMNK